MAGRKFLEMMNQYIQDLQQSAVQQIQLRAHVSRIGMDKDTITAMDLVLSQMDRRIVEIGAEMSVLWQELSNLEIHHKSHVGVAPLQLGFPSSEIAAF